MKCFHLCFGVQLVNISRASPLFPLPLKPTGGPVMVPLVRPANNPLEQVRTLPGLQSLR